MLLWVFQSALCCCFALPFLAAANGGLFKDMHSKWLDHADTDVAYPVLLHSESGFSTSDLLPSRAERNKRTAGTGKRLLLYHLNGFGIDYELQMTSNDKLVSPSVLVQTIQDKSMGEEVVTEYITNEGCHLSGWVRADGDGVTNSTQWGHAAISVCDGNMIGVMKMHDYEVHIEVAAGGEIPRKHILRRRSLEVNVFEEKYCHITEADDVEGKQRQSEHSKRAAGRMRTKRQSFDNQTLYVETLVAIDRVAQKQWKKLKIAQFENYTLTLLNIANMLWANEATGFDVRIVVTRIVFLNKLDFRLSKNSVVLVKKFCDWQNSMNSQNDSLLFHHDYAVLITGNELCPSGKKPCGEFGRTHRSAMCNPSKSCQVATSAGFRTGFVIAHELGHSFGMVHDEGNHCGNQQGLMAATASAKSDLFLWSSCSLRDIQDYLKTTSHYACLLDSLPAGTRQFEDRWAGSRYDLNAQCSFQVGEKTTVCNSGERVCQALVCRKSLRCSTVYAPALDGSVCGHKKVCVRGRCVLESEKEKHTLVAGAWCEWSAVSNCSKSCGGGLNYRTRICNCPRPSDGGQFCEGRNYTVELCNTLPCLSSIDPRVKFCRNKTDSNGNPMEPYYKGNDTCSLHCFSTVTNEVVTMGELIEDGTKCNPTVSSNDRCFRGQCERFGCDYKWQSKSLKDYCGVCQGTQRKCKFRSGTFFANELTNSGYHKVVTIPSQATNILIEENGILNDSYLAVQVVSPRLQVYVVNGNNQPGVAWSSIEAAGTVIEYWRPSYAHETIRIKGPLQLPLNIMILLTQRNNSLSPRIKWEYSMLLDRVDFGTGRKEYIWEKVEGPCSKTCRGGFQDISFYCQATIGGRRVKYQYCDRTATRRPKSQTIACNTDVLCNGGSPVYNWHIGNWSQCSATCGRSQKGRDVRCYDKTSSVYVDNNYYRCQGEMPATVQRCNVPACKKKPVDGGWSEWKALGDCSKSCGSGITLETRTCTNPKPSNGGKPCFGTEQRQLCCNIKTCFPPTINGFSAQCRNKYPESKAVFSSAELSLCKIRCQLPDGSVNTVDAEDGTRCQLRSSSRCLNKSCVPVGCDCEFGSTKTSGCGICYNQSANCKLFTSKYSLQNHKKGWHTILSVPIGAYHLRVWKGDVTSVSTGIQSFRSEFVSVNSFRRSGESLFVFGGEVRYTSTSDGETLLFYGPTAEKLQIVIYLFRNVDNQESAAIHVSYVKQNE